MCRKEALNKSEFSYCKTATIVAHLVNLPARPPAQYDQQKLKFQWINLIASLTHLRSPGQNR